MGKKSGDFLRCNGSIVSSARRVPEIERSIVNVQGNPGKRRGWAWILCRELLLAYRSVRSRMIESGSLVQCVLRAC